MGRAKRTSVVGNPRWDCSRKCLPVPLDREDWKYLLETLAKELYDLSHQLQEVPPSGEPCSSTHPGNAETQTPTEATVGEDGAWNGKDPEHAV